MKQDNFKPDISKFLTEKCFALTLVCSCILKIVVCVLCVRELTVWSVCMYGCVCVCDLIIRRMCVHVCGVCDSTVWMLKREDEARVAIVFNQSQLFRCASSQTNSESVSEMSEPYLTQLGYDNL